MRVLSYNIKDGGFDHDGDRMEQILEVVRSANADVVCLMEAAAFHPVGRADRSSRRFHRFAHGSGLSGLVLETPSSHYLAVFARPALPVLSAEPARGLFFHGALCVTMAHRPRPLLVIATHLHGFSSLARASEAECLAWYANHHARQADVVLCGDLNSLSPQDLADGLYDPDDPGWPPRLRDVQGHVDKTPASILLRSGLVDCFRAANPTDLGHTDPPPRFAKPGEPSRRLDFIFATKELAHHLKSCEVLTASPADTASDHYPVLAEFGG